MLLACIGVCCRADFFRDICLRNPRQERLFAYRNTSQVHLRAGLVRTIKIFFNEPGISKSEVC